MKPTKDQTPTEAYDDLYATFMERGVLPSVFADEGFLRKMGIFEQVESALELSGWKDLLAFSCDANVEDTCEFLASVVLVGKYMRYRHRGIYYQATRKHLKRAFKWTTRSRDETDQHTDDEAWEALTWSDKKFRAGRSLGSEIREPRFFYLQRLVSHKVLARYNGSQRLGVLDMAVMKGLVYGTKVKYGEIMMEHWAKIKPTGKVTAGGMITYYLRRMHRLDHEMGQTVLVPEILTKAKMSRTNDANDEAEWSHEGFAAVPMSEGVPTKDEDIFEQEAAQAEETNKEQPAARVRKPRGPARAQGPLRRSARARKQASSSSAQAQGSAWGEFPWMDPQAQRRWMFNVERVMEFHAPDFAIMNIEPPPEWTPGMPIPSGYRMREEVSDDESHEDDIDNLEAGSEPESSGSPTF